MCKVAASRKSKGTPRYDYQFGASERSDIEAAMTMGVNAYLKKPYDSEDLIKTITTFLKD